MSEVAARYDLPPETDLNASSDVERTVNGHVAEMVDSDVDVLSSPSSLVGLPRRRSSLLIGDTSSPFRWYVPQIRPMGWELDLTNRRAEYLTPPERLAQLRKPL